jgi:hypothetical protein
MTVSISCDGSTTRPAKQQIEADAPRSSLTEERRSNFVWIDRSAANAIFRLLISEVDVLVDGLTQVTLLRFAQGVAIRLDAHVNPFVGF